MLTKKRVLLFVLVKLEWHQMIQRDKLAIANEPTNFYFNQANGLAYESYRAFEFQGLMPFNTYSFQFQFTEYTHLS